MKKMILIAASILLASSVANAQTVKVKGAKVGKQSVTVVDADGSKTTVKTENGKSVIKTDRGKTIVRSEGEQKKKVAAKKKAPNKTLFECQKNQVLSISDKTFEGGLAVNAHGNCQLSLKNVKIIGTDIGIEVYGNASVTIVNSSIVAPLAVYVHGNSELTTKKVSVKGKTKTSGNGNWTKN